MRESLMMRKSLLPTLLVLSLLIAIVSLPASITAQPNSTAIVYIDPPTIVGVTAGEEFTVNISISNAVNVTSWGAGLIFNASLLECIRFYQGEFLKDIASTWWFPGTIDNTAGVVTAYGCGFYGEETASGDGRLAYATFRVKAPGTSDLHLRDVMVLSTALTPVNIIDVFTAVVDTTPHKVVTISNSTGSTGAYRSGFYAHAYSPALEMLSFNVTGPYPGFSNVTVPKTLFWIVHVIIDGVHLGTDEVTIMENATHTFAYFTYGLGIHKIQLTSRISSTISMTLSSTEINLGESVTINGNVTAEDLTTRPDVTVTIHSRPVGAVTWNTVDTVKTDSNSSYTYIWTPETGGTHEVMASWEGDEETLGAKSDVVALMVLYVFEPLSDIYVVIETNSTVAEFNSIPALDFSQPLKQVSFNVTSPYGTRGYSNVTIPKALLPPPEPPIEWKVVVNGTSLSAEERIVTENATHTSIHFEYPAGIYVVQITTRMGSIISTTLSSPEIDLGESVTISGSITAENQTARPNVNVTISYRLRYDVTWDTLDTVETGSDGNYTCPWAPGVAGVYEVMASWEGDDICIGDKGDVMTLKVMQISNISITLSSATIAFGSNVTISGSINPLKPSMSVYILYRATGGEYWAQAGETLTAQDSSYTFTWTPYTPGTYEVKAMWLGDEITYNATSSVLTLTAKWTSTISIGLSSTEITLGKTVTINGAINPKRANVTVTILYRLNGGNWTLLDTVETDEDGNYTCPWAPGVAGVYEVMASWEGDEETLGAKSEVSTLTVKEAPVGIPLEIVAVAVVAIIIIAAIVVYFVKFRKPKP